MTVPTTTIALDAKAFVAVFVLSTAFDETVTRVRGVLSVTSDQTGATQEIFGALGLVRITDRAGTAGAASIPGPITDIDDDGWMTYVPFCTRGASTTGSMQMVVPFDSKAQRIVRQGEQVAVMIENASAVDGIQIVLVLRLLSRFRS